MPGELPRRADTGRGAASHNPSRSATLPAAFLAARPPARDMPARTWVYRHVSGAIVEGLLWPGLRLPSARALSGAWAVARGAVDEALMRLAHEGLVERRVGRGSFVARRLPPGLVREVSGRAALARVAGETLDGLAPLLRISRTAVQREAQARRAPVPDSAAPASTSLSNSASASSSAPAPMLDGRVADTALFPLAAWRRCMAAAHAEADRASLCYGPPTGSAALRAATARHLALTRGLDCRPEQVLILNGPLQTLDLVVRVLLEPGDRVVVESPGYLSMARHLGLPPLDLHGMPVDDDGLDVEMARRECPAPALINVQPLHQFPTGARLSPRRRAALMEWAHACRAWVVEADHLGEIVHDGPAPPTLLGAGPQARADDEHNTVLFLGSFNGVMFPALRLSYLVVPQRLVPAFTAVRGLFGDHPPLAPQQALARFIDEGHLSAHLRRMREFYLLRRDAARAAAARHLPGAVRVGPLTGGTHGCLHLPAGCADETLAERLAAAGFGIEMLSSYSWPRPGTGGLVFGYGAEDEARIEAGMRLLGSHLRDALAGRPLPRGGPAAHDGLEASAGRANRVNGQSRPSRAGAGP